MQNVTKKKLIIDSINITKHIVLYSEYSLLTAIFKYRIKNTEYKKQKTKP